MVPPPPNNTMAPYTSLWHDIRAKAKALGPEAMKKLQKAEDKAIAVLSELEVSHDFRSWYIEVTCWDHMRKYCPMWPQEPFPGGIVPKGVDPWRDPATSSPPASVSQTTTTPREVANKSPAGDSKAADEKLRFLEIRAHWEELLNAYQLVCYYARYLSILAVDKNPLDIVRFNQMMLSNLPDYPTRNPERRPGDWPPFVSAPATGNPWQRVNVDEAMRELRIRLFALDDQYHDLGHEITKLNADPKGDAKKLSKLIEQHAKLEADLEKARKDLEDAEAGISRCSQFLPPASPRQLRQSAPGPCPSGPPNNGNWP